MAATRWWLDSPDDYLGQSLLLSASVFNFFSAVLHATRCHRAGRAGRPEFQNASDTQVVGSTNFFSRMISDGGIDLTIRTASLTRHLWLAAASSTASC